MKIIFINCVLLLVLVSCQNKPTNKSATGTDSNGSAETKTELTSDTTALILAKEILADIKNGNYEKIADYTGANQTIRFSPYGYIDTANDKQLSISQLLQYITDKKTTKFKWGNYGGSGEDILLTTDEYFKRFVYDKDFLTAEKISLNKTVSKSNSLNNTDSIYPGCIYVEFYFPGFEKKYAGMDWRSLTLVFKKNLNQLYLVAFIHDEWTV